jgi:hypothetical protein
VTIARSIARPIASPIASRTPIIGGGLVPPAFDADALSYFSAVEGVSGSFDLSSINAIYTESYVKSAHSELFVGLKADGVWSRVTELYLLIGKTFAGLSVKAKGIGAITNNNFVTGDWAAAGSGGGLIGNGSTNWLGTGRNQNQLVDNSGCGGYLTEMGSAASVGQIIGNAGVGGGNAFGVISDQNISTFASRIKSVDISSVAMPTPATGPITSSRNSASQISFSHRGALLTNATNNLATAAGDLPIELFRRGTGLYYSGRIAAGWIVESATTSENITLHNRINTFITALGSNVY